MCVVCLALYGLRLCGRTASEGPPKRGRRSFAPRWKFPEESGRHCHVSVYYLPTVPPFRPLTRAKSIVCISGCRSGIARKVSILGESDNASARGIVRAVKRTAVIGATDQRTTSGPADSILRTKRQKT